MVYLRLFINPIQDKPGLQIPALEKSTNATLISQNSGLLKIKLCFTYFTDRYYYFSAYTWGQ